MSDETVDPRGKEILDFDAKAFEEQLLKEAQERAADPVETASQAYGMYVPHFKKGLPKISTRGLRRVLQYLVLYPLEQDAIKSASDEEKQFMHLVNSLVEAKFILIMSSYQQNAEAVYNAQNAELTQEQKDEVVTTLRAGGVPEEEIEKLIAANAQTEEK